VALEPQVNYPCRTTSGTPLPSSIPADAMIFLTLMRDPTLRSFVGRLGPTILNPGNVCEPQSHVNRPKPTRFSARVSPAAMITAKRAGGQVRHGGLSWRKLRQPTASFASPPRALKAPRNGQSRVQAKCPNVRLRAKGRSLKSLHSLCHGKVPSATHSRRSALATRLHRLTAMTEWKTAAIIIT
jgi:hypothetical protein